MKRAPAEWATANDVRLSCSRTGNCHDDGVVKSFSATLRNEMCYRESFATRVDARRALAGFIESYYNMCRPHSFIGCRIPGRVMDDFSRRTVLEPENLPMAA
ncbi:MAG: integrase core domain-containing protein [Eggerthellaceae bacterium]